MWLALALGGCGPGEPELDAHAVALAHAEQLEELSRWARRLDSTASTFASRAALEEAAFARYRRDESIYGVWIERQGPDPSTLAHPAGAQLPELRWQRARVRSLGEVEVARTTLAQGTALVLRHRSAVGDGAQLVVTLALRPAPL